MATTEGHLSRRSEHDGRIDTGRIVTEAVSANLQESHVSLDYYRPPRSRRNAPQRAPGGIINEAALAGLPVETATQGPLADAAIASFGDTIVLEVVLGNDDRVRVKDRDLRRNPFRQICALRIKAQDGSMYVGTGWFVGARAVATAGHCVYLHKAGGWAASIEVIPAKFGSREPYLRFVSKRYRAPDGWAEQKRAELDYGLILLEDESIGGRLGWFETSAESDARLSAATANISGYPADRDSANYQYFHARPLTPPTQTRLQYDIDTFGGQSGSPVWLEMASGVVAVGIHTTGGATSNSGVRITEPVIDNFLAWRDE
jgi:V8-like Glu-specific endopeptidase